LRRVVAVCGIVQDPADGLPDATRRGPAGPEVDADANPAYSRRHLRFVLGVPGDDERHAIPQALLDSAEAAVADQDRRTREELLVGEVAG
jgi:hypothetical protein